MKVLSLFDGMSCGRIALSRTGFEVEKYYASEIDLNSMKIAMKNYPDTIHIGNVLDIDEDQLASFGEIDLLMGGSPCQNLSISNSNNEGHNQGLEGEKSSLFYEYVRVLKMVKPKYFLYENVASMKDKDKDIITEFLGVQPIMIDSNLVSAQDRKRYYWTNINVLDMPEDRKIVIRDILEQDVADKYFYWQGYTYHGEDKKIEATLRVKGHDMLKRVYNKDGKCGTLTACRGGYKQKKVLDGRHVRKLTPLEYERLQTVPEGYTEGVADIHRYNMLGDGWTVDIVAHILKYIEKG